MGSLISGIGSLIGSGEAARKANAASSNLNERYKQISGFTQPFIQAGQNVLDPLTTLATSGPTAGGPDYVSQAAGMVPLQMTQAQLEQTPGYQFTRDQTLKALQASASARGLGVSGAEMRAGANYATNLANTTYKDQFNMAQTRYSDVLGLNTAQQGNITNQYSRLAGVAGIGANAAANLGTVGANLGGAQANQLNAAGLDQAYGTQALATGIGNTVNQVMGAPTGSSGTGPSLNMQAANWLGQTISGSQSGTPGYNSMTSYNVPAFNQTLGY